MNKAHQLEGHNNKNIIRFELNSDFYFTKGVKAFQKQKFDLAVKWLNKAVELEPENALYLCQLSIVYTEIGSYYRSNELLNRALQYSEDSDCYYLLANNYAHLGLLDDALKYAQVYLDREPEGEFVDEVSDLIDLIDFELEDEFDDDWLFEAGDDLLKYQESAFYYMENYQWDKAMPLIEDMLLLYPEHLIVKHDYTQILFHLGERKKAIALEEKILPETDHKIQSKINLLLFYFKTENLPAYEAILLELCNVYPIHSDQQIKLAVNLAKTNNYTEAIKRFNHINQQHARGHVSYFEWFSIAHYRLGNEMRAAEIWEVGCTRHKILKERDYKLLDKD